MMSRDSHGRPVVVVTGAGIVTSLGAGKDENWKKLAAGQSGIRQIGRFPTEGLKTKIGGTVDFLLDAPFSSPELSHALAETAVDEAVTQAKLGQPGRFPGPLFIAVPPVEVEWPQREAMARELNASSAITYPDLWRNVAERHQEWHPLFLYGGVAEQIADRFGTQGSPISLSTACASGATAIQLGVEAIRRGETEAALTVGTDGSIHPEALIRFSLLSALSTQNDVPEGASRPFSKNRSGFIMAEGAAALVLESLDHAKARGAPILGVIAGCGERAESFHRTRPNPDGKAMMASMTLALEDAGLTPADIDYINAHGTSTPENDKMEAMACTAVFGERMTSLPISSNKSMIGHTLTAAGAIEAVLSLLTLQHQLLPPTINHHIPDPAITLDVVPNEARAAKVRHIMSNSFGFGGQNVALVLAGEPV